MDDPMRGQEYESEDMELDPGTEARIDAMIEQAERDIAEMRRTGDWGPGEESIPIETPAAETARPTDVTVRFLRYQVEILDRAARLSGTTLEAFIAETAFHAAAQAVSASQRAAKAKEQAA